MGLIITGDTPHILSDTYYLTFAAEHRHPMTGEPMEGYYVKIQAEDDESARFAAFDLFHDNFAIMYNSKEFEPHKCPKGEYASCVAKPFNIRHDQSQRD